MSYILREMPTWVEYVDDFGYYRLERFDTTYGNKRPKVQHKNQNVKQRKQEVQTKITGLTGQIQS